MASFQGGSAQSQFQEAVIAIGNLASRLCELLDKFTLKANESKDDLPRYITRSDAARMLDVSTKSIDRWIRLGKLASHKLGPNSIRLEVAEVQALMTRRNESRNGR